MQAISICARPRKTGGLVALWCGGMALAWAAQAGQYQLAAEQANTVVVAARVQNAEQVCNLEITVQGQPTEEREVQAPHFETRIDITPQDTESVAVSWRGKFKRVNGVVVNPCPTQGSTQFQVVADNVALRAAWGRWLLGMGPAKAECVRTALQLDRVRYEWFDTAAPQASPEDWKIQRALSQCDAFLAQKKAWGEQNPKGFACTLAGGLKTRCEGFFSATEKNKAQPISMEAAIRRQLDGLPWATGVRETAGAKASRFKQELATKAQQAAEEEARLKAEEQARLREIQLAQEAQAAQARARKEKAEADHARRLQEIERKEQERLEKRSWLLKQLEKLKRDPEGDAKAKEGEAKDGQSKDGQGKDSPTPNAAVQVKPPETKAPDPKVQEPKVQEPKASEPKVQEPKPEQPQAEVPKTN